MMENEIMKRCEWVSDLADTVPFLSLTADDCEDVQ